MNQYMSEHYFYAANGEYHCSKKLHPQITEEFAVVNFLDSGTQSIVDHINLGALNGLKEAIFGKARPYDNREGDSDETVYVIGTYPTGYKPPSY